MANDFSWQELYKAAMLELDHTLMHSRIEEARTAIRRAREELISKDGNVEDRQAMTEALRSLQTLQRLEAKIPMPASAQGEPMAER